MKVQITEAVSLVKDEGKYSIQHNNQRISMDRETIIEAVQDAIQFPTFQCPADLLLMAQEEID